jgi:hemerythrin-like domain-containing protein
MLRNKNLIPLSHQHRRALVLCVRIDRASPISDADLNVWLSEIAQHFRNEIKIHFAAEEQVLFPAAQRFEELIPLIEELTADHAWLRDRFTEAEDKSMRGIEITELAAHLSSHIRKEERQLFERLQKLMSETELAALGSQLATALKDAEQACIVPTGATRFRSTR